MEKALSIPARRLLLSAIFILATQQITYSQNPGGVTGSVAWYKANAGVTLTSGFVSTWNDNSASANHATQGTAANRPGLATNSVNFNPAVTFLIPATAQFLTTAAAGLPGGNTARSVFFVASFNNSATSDAWFYGYGGAASGCRKYNVGKLLGNNQLLVSGSTCLMDPANTFWATTDFPKLGSIVYNAVNGTFYDAGTSLGADADPGFNTQTNAGTIGTFHTNAAEFWRGTVAELIVFPSAVTGTNAVKIESYLALKYGIHKSGSYISSGGLSMWDASINASFHNDVFGIIVDNGSGLSQLQSNSANTGSGNGAGQSGKGNIVLSAASLNNNEYMIIGHNTNNMVFDNSNVPASLAGSYSRMNRVWLINRSSTIASANVTGQFNYSGLAIVDPSVAGAFKLLVDTDGDNDFSNATVIDPASVNTGTSVVTFDVPITTALNAAQVSFAASAAALPVKLKSFAYNTRGCNATLKWTSLSEENLKGYVIEENINNAGWNKIKEIAAAANNLSTEKNYSTEVTLQPGKNNFYRLKMIDINGTYNYSAILRIRCEGGRPEILLMPNPASSRITVSGIEPGDVIRIYSIKGAFIKTVTTAGNVEELNISPLPAGSYSAEVIRNEKRVFSKVFIKN